MGVNRTIGPLVDELKVCVEKALNLICLQYEDVLFTCHINSFCLFEN